MLRRACASVALTAPAAVGLVAWLSIAVGCAPVYWVGIKFLYDEVPLPASQVVLDVPYD